MGRAPPARPALGSRDRTFERGGRRAPRDAERQGDIGAALSGTRDTLFAAGIRMDEAAIRRTVRGRSVWTGGPRIRQAIHVLEQERYLWPESGGRDDVPIEDARPEDPGPVLVLRALKSRGNVYRIDGGMAELPRTLASK